MAEERDNQDKAVQDLLTSIGVISEISLVFYRNVIKAGASENEATKLTQAFIAANIFGGAGSK